MDVINLYNHTVELAGAGVYPVNCDALADSGLTRVVFQDGRAWGESVPFKGQEDVDQDAAGAILQAARDLVPRTVFDQVTGEPLEILTGDPVPATHALELTAAAQAYLVAEAARFERDQVLRASDPLMLPDRDFTAEQMQTITEYRQALRDWPDTAGFPDLETLPELTL